MFYRRQVIKSQIAGVFLGLVGAIGLLYSGSFNLNYYGLFVVLATLLYGISTNEVSKVQGINGLQITSLAFLILMPFAVVLFLSTDYHAPVETENWLRNLGFIAILSVVGSAVALALFYLLVRDTSPVFASMTTYFIPLIATAWGFADNEHLTSSMLISILVIFAGVYLINRPGLLGNLRKVLR
jgi:drug/metabolite transporter (DMT)-like permease